MPRPHLVRTLLLVGLVALVCAGSAWMLSSRASALALLSSRASAGDTRDLQFAAFAAVVPHLSADVTRLPPAAGSAPRRTTVADLDSVARMMRGTLRVNGQPVVEQLNPFVGTRIALATCSAHHRAILYANEQIGGIGLLAFEFVRDHELAHHRLGHVDCSGNDPQLTQVQESAADCWAADSLSREGVHGRQVLAAAAGMLRRLDAPSSAAYRSSRQRASDIERGCAGP
ncbi:MAG: hypothetical protein JWO05_3839 [Gemmatimonadetes bacterium]|nr:hypothetical protein [Gemmatimonadota bacterium]